MSFQGEIASIPLGDVVQNLVANQKSGTLSVQSGELECHVQFECGVVVSYVDNRGVEIARWLVEKEVVDRESMRDALKRHRRSKKRTLGEILARIGALDLDEYRRHLGSLIHDYLCECLMVDRGAFEFREGLVDGPLSNREMRGLGLRFAPQNLLMEAARRSDDWANIRRHLPSEDEIYFAREVPVEIDEESTTDLALHLFDGSRTVRQVLAKLPDSRFEAIRTVAQLIAEGSVERIHSDHAVEQSDSRADPRESIACLKVILDREPRNLAVLSRLARLYASVGDNEEAAKYHKILAVAYLEDGDLPSAEATLRKAIELNSRDLRAWQRLWECLIRSGDEERSLAFGREFVDHFQRLGLAEVVRDHCEELTRRFPDVPEFRVKLAEARFSLGDQKRAVEGLIECGNEHLRAERYEEAEEVFARALKYDHRNPIAKKRHAEIRAGKIARRKAFFRKLRRDLVVAASLAIGMCFIWQEVRVQGALLSAMRVAIAETSPASREEAARRGIEEIRREYPFSVTASIQGEAFLKTVTYEESSNAEVAPTSAKDGLPPLLRRE